MSRASALPVKLYRVINNDDDGDDDDDYDYDDDYTLR